MYTVSQRYKDAIKSLSREFNITIDVVTKSNQTFTLTDTNLKQGSTIFDSAVMSGDVLEIGSVISSSFECEIILDQTLKTIDFAEAILEPTITLILPATETYPTPSYEDIPMGVFHVDSVNKGRKTTKIKALDNLSRLDKDYSQSTLTYPATLEQIYSDICSFIGVGEDPNFTTYNYTVPRKPKPGVTFRNVLGSLAEINGSFAKCDRSGKILIEWLKTNDSIETHIDPNTRSKLKTDDFIQPITGVTMETISNTYTGLGSQSGNVVDLSENLLIQNNQQAVLDNFNNLGIYQTYVVPHKTSWSGDPALDTGDRISVTTIDNETFNTNITTNKYKYGGSSESSCGAQLKGSTNVIQSGSKNQSDTGDAVKAVAAAMGLYVTSDSSGYYIHNQPTLEDSTTVYSGETVVDPPPGYGYPWVLALDSDFITDAYGGCSLPGTIGFQYPVLPQTVKGLPITSCKAMFHDTSLGGVISEYNSATNMADAFYNLGSDLLGGYGTLDISRFYTKLVTGMSGMFRLSKYMTIQLGSLFDTSKVVNMESMFYQARIENIDLTVFNTANVQRMDLMFSGADMGLLDFSSFNTSKVFNMTSMFRFCDTQQLYLSSFDTHLVTTMNYMFDHTTALHIDVSSFNTTKVTNMSYMFAGISPLDPLDLTSFTTLTVKNMSYMFNNAKLDVVDLRSFNMSGVTNTANMFAGCTATVGVARTQSDADILNATTNKPAALTFYPI